MYACVCRAKSDTEIRRLIKDGNNTVKKLAQCDVGTQCGLCWRAYICDILKEERSKSQ